MATAVMLSEPPPLSGPEPSSFRVRAFPVGSPVESPPMARSTQSIQGPRLVFLTREPVLHQQGGSTTYALGLLDLLRQHARVTLVATVAYSRSPRLFFRLQMSPPEGIRLRFPGYLRLGNLYLCPFRLKAWARAASRWKQARGGPRWWSRLAKWIYGDTLFTQPWDLTAPTPAERRIAMREIAAAGATGVLANYCFWGPFLSGGELVAQRTAILMHDLLSARIQRFLDAGLALDCPPLSAAEEMRWLSGAQTVLASQEREAETIRPSVSAHVLVAPITLRPRTLDASMLVPGRCLFVGSNIQPNRTALAFLLQQVWPLVRSRLPSATLAIVGTVCQAIGEYGEPDGLRSQGVEALGQVASLEEQYARAAVCVVPLLVGSGIKIKLVEALGYGKAIVSTSVGIQGLEAWAQASVLVADTAEDFARGMNELLQDEEERRAAEFAALQLAETHFGLHRHLDSEFMAILQ